MGSMINQNWDFRMVLPTEWPSHNPRRCTSRKSSFVQVIGRPSKAREMKESNDTWMSTMAKRLGMFLFFCVFRIVNVFLIQSKFDPDEYWQQLEPAYCEVFMKAGNPCPGLTWEWKRRPPSTEINSLSDFLEVGMKGPLRSYASILPTLIFYHAIKYFGLDSPWAVARGPVFLNAILVAAPTDWSVWYLSRWMMPQTQSRDGSLSTFQSLWCTYCVLSSWFCAYALVRTYSNSLETLLLMISLCLVGPVRVDTVSRHAVRETTMLTPDISCRKGTHGRFRFKVISQQHFTSLPCIFHRRS